MTDWVQDILNSSFIEALFEIIMGVVTAIVSVLLFPFSVLIKNYLPAFDSALTQIASYFDLIKTYIGWATSAVGLPSVVVAMLVGYWTFSITVTLSAWLVKLVIKWKGALW